MVKKQFNADKWLEKHLAKLVDRFPGEYILVAEGRIYRGGTPSQLRRKIRSKYPRAKILGLRIPRPRDFLCALIIR